MIVADAIVETLRREGVTTFFCFPTTSMIEAAVAGGLRPVICRQERVGVHMADGFARVTNGKPVGVFAMQYGPGAENAFAGVASAYSEFDADPAAATRAFAGASSRCFRCSVRRAAMRRLPSRSKPSCNRSKRRT